MLRDCLGQMLRSECCPVNSQIQLSRCHRCEADYREARVSASEAELAQEAEGTIRAHHICTEALAVFLISSSCPSEAGAHTRLAVGASRERRDITVPPRNAVRAHRRPGHLSPCSFSTSYLENSLGYRSHNNKVGHIIAEASALICEH